jgi:GNAT superfamily N-acetyltransferase
MDNDKGIEIAGYVPGAVGRLVELHAAYYGRNWNFGPFFEAKVAKEAGEFLERFDPDRDCFWTICRQGTVEGTIAVDGLEAAGQGAHLRWFIVSPSLQGAGWGRRLLERAVSFSDSRPYGRLFLWTFAGLDRARRLYEAFGFRLVLEQEGRQWGSLVTEQRFERLRP